MPQCTTSLTSTIANNLNRILSVLKKYEPHTVIAVALPIASAQFGHMMALLKPHCNHINLGNSTNTTDVSICDDLSRITGSMMTDVKLITGIAISFTTLILGHKSFQAKTLAGIEALSLMVSAGSFIPILEFLSGLKLIEFNLGVTIPGTGTGLSNTVVYASMILIGIILAYTLEYPFLKGTWERKKNELKIESNETIATEKSQKKTHRILNSLFAFETSSAFSFLIWNLLAEMRFWEMDGKETIESVLSWIGFFSTLMAGIVFSNLGNKTIQICGHDTQLDTDNYANKIFKYSKATTWSNIVYGGISNLLFVIDPTSTFEENPHLVGFYAALCLSGSAHVVYYCMKNVSFNSRINEEINSAFEEKITGALKSCKKNKSKEKIYENNKKEIDLILINKDENKSEEKEFGAPETSPPTNGFFHSMANFFRSLCGEKSNNINDLKTPLLP